MTGKESNVVQLKPAESVSQLGQINTALINLYQEHLFSLIEPSVQHIIQYLVKRSESGENNSEIMRSMELKHQFEKLQTAIKDSFCEISLNNFDNWEHNDNSLESIEGELSLVENTSLDLKLAWQSAAKLLSIGDELIQLTDSEHRLSPLIDLKPENNPIGPFKICESLSEAIKPIHLEAEESKEILAEFVRQIKPAVATLWKATDQYLESQGLKVIKPKTSIASIPEKEPLSSSDSPEGLTTHNSDNQNSSENTGQGNDRVGQRPNHGDIGSTASGVNTASSPYNSSTQSHSESGAGSGLSFHPSNHSESAGHSSANSNETGSQGSGQSQTSNVSSLPNSTMSDAGINTLDDSLMDAIAQKVVNRVEGLLTQYGSPTGGPAVEGSEANDNVTVFAAVELATTLTAIQEELNGQQTCLFDLTESIQAALQERGVKDKISPRHNDLINIVGMLFEFILDDHELPKEVKHLVGLLQIPVLKLALLDEDFLSNREHPARQLLNDMTSAGMHTVYEPITAEPVIELIEHSVKTIIKNFMDNPDIFPACLEAFNLSLEEIRKHIEADIEQEQEQEQQSDSDSESEPEHSESYQTIKAITERYQIPAAIDGFVFGVWSNVLNDYSTDSDDEKWYTVTNTLDMLLWNLQPENLPKITAEHWLSVKNYIVDLLTETQLESSELSEWMNTLNVLIATPVPTSETIEITIEEEPDSIELSIETSDEEEEIVLSTNSLLSKPEPEITEQPSSELLSDTCEEFDKDCNDEKCERVDLNISIGQWVEFVGKDGQLFRCKLARINKQSDRYVFVNNAGVKVSSKRSYQLARDIEKGRLRIMDSTPFFDKALHAVMHRFLKI